MEQLNKKKRICRKLNIHVVELLRDRLDLNHNQNLLNEIPKKYEKINDLILFPEKSFISEIWQKYLKEIADIYRCKRIAIKSRISNNDFRSPNIKIIYPKDCMDEWVHKKELGIIYHYNILKNMFSKGNITEKQRLSKMDCSDEIIVDLFCGVGYFTLVFLIHCNAKHVHACDWNPIALEALQKNLVANNIVDKCTIYFGDSKTQSPKSIANRVNLGILPSSQSFWKAACECLNVVTGGIIHVHENVKSDSIDLFSKYVIEQFADILVELNREHWDVRCLNIIKIKSYGPKIEHIVIDIECKPT